MLKNHTTKFHLTCFIITLPFYAHAQEQTPNLEQQVTQSKQPNLVWNFTITRTTPDVSQEWLQLIVDYDHAAKKILTPEMLEELRGFYYQLQKIQEEKYFGVTYDSRIPDPSDNQVKELQPFLGQRLATFLEQRTHNDGIHGKLDLNFYELNTSCELGWNLEIYLDETYDHEAFNTIKNNLAMLTDELNTASLTPDNQNYGSLLHGVAATAQQTQAYNCNATLTLQS